MQTTRFEFGFLPQRLDMSVGDIAIETRADFDKIIDGHREWEGVEGDWIYAPLQQLTTSPGRQVRELPYTSRVFGLPKTHTISLGDANKEPGYLEFCIWTLSFFLGIRLTTTEAGFLDATPIKPSVLTDFFVSDRDLPKALALANAFWSSHQGDPTGAKRLGAAVHALFLAQSPHYLQFERFFFLYTALDACYALAASIGGLKRNPPHSVRIPWICNQFNMPTPEWARTESGGRAPIVELRNNAIHEALFMDEPLGFAIHGVGLNQNLPLEMSALICRLLVALIGGKEAPYVRSPVNTRARYSLALP